MTDGSNMIDGNHLRSYVERVEKLEAEKADIAALIKDVYAEAKGTGFDPKMIRRIVAMRKQDESKRRAEEEILDLYLAALGM